MSGALIGAPRRYTPTQRSLAASLLAMSEPLAGPDQTTVVLPVTLADLSARSGRSRTCGTVYAHARALSGAVKRAPGQAGWVLDLPALRAIARHHTDKRPQAPPTPSRPTTASPAPSPSSALPTPATEILALLRDVVRLAERLVVELNPPGAAVVADADQLNARLRDTIARLEPREPREAHADLANPTRTSRELRDIASSSRSPDRREGESFTEELPAQNLPPSLNRLASRDTAAPRPSRPPLANPTSDPSHEQRPGPDLETLLAPLVRFSQRTGLVGVTDRQAAGQALAPYTDEQIRHAVNQTLALAKAGVITHSPIGWLVAKARDQNADFFPSTPRPTTTATRPNPPATPEQCPDPDAAEAVAALEADPQANAAELADLDQRIAAGGPLGRRLLADPVMRRAARRTQWRATHPVPPSGEQP